MADIDRIVQVTITRQTTVPSIASFDNPIIAAEFLTTDITPNMQITDRVRSYGSISEVATAFGTSSEIYAIASKIFAQSPSVDLIYVGRKKTGGEGSETWSEALTAMREDDDNWYAVIVATRTEAEQEDAADWTETNKKLLGLASGDADIITGTGDIIEYLNTNNYDRSWGIYHQDSNDNNIATVVYDSDFVTGNSIEVVVNTNSVITAFDTDQDTTMNNIKANIEADTNLAGITVELTDTAGDNRTLEIYWLGTTLTVTSTVTLGASQPVATITYTTADDYPEAAWFGRMLPKDPGSATWKFKTLTGVSPSDLLTSEKNTITGKEGNFYYTVSNRDITEEGTVGSGEFIDVIRGVDWLEARIQQLVFTPLVQQDKVPYTNAGIESVNTQLKAALQEGVDINFLASFTTTVPDVADISVTDKGNRVLPDVKFTAILASAIHRVVINGIVSL